MMANSTLSCGTLEGDGEEDMVGGVHCHGDNVMIHHGLNLLYWDTFLLLERKYKERNMLMCHVLS